MPKTPVEKIDSELNVAVALQNKKNGNGFLKGKNFQTSNRMFGNLTNLTSKAPFYKNVPLLALIINARVNPASDYNKRTGGVFARAESPFKGKSRAAGATAMLEAMRRVLSARHSSTGFFKVCAKAVWLIFKDATTSSPLRRPPSDLAMGSEALPGSGKVSKNIGRIAGGTVATSIRDNARASFWVAATEPDTKGTPGGAIYRIAQPVWQRAVDEVSAKQMQVALEMYSNAAAESGIRVMS